MGKKLETIIINHWGRPGHHWGYIVQDKTIESSYILSAKVVKREKIELREQNKIYEEIELKVENSDFPTPLCDRQEIRICTIKLLKKVINMKREYEKRNFRVIKE